MEAVDQHFKRHHAVPCGIAEDVFQKWVSKMACAIKLLTIRFRRLFSVSDGAKSKKMAGLKLTLRHRLQALYGDEWKSKEAELELEPVEESADATELLPSPQWLQLEKLVKAYAVGEKQLPASAAVPVAPVPTQPLKAKEFQAKLDRLVLPPEAGCLIATCADN